MRAEIRTRVMTSVCRQFP